MIRELRINNLAIIKDVELELDTNFSSLTGETGAGKSIILDGIALLTGARANSSVIRKGEEKLSVEAVLSLNEKIKENLKEIADGIDFSDDELIIYREVSVDGKSKINVNGKRVTLTTLSKLMEQLVDIVGQHENQYLLNKTYHRDLLDGFITIDKYRLKNIVSDINELSDKIQKLEEERKSVIEKKEYYEFSIGEIDKLNLYEDIDKELEAEYKLIFNSGRVNDAYKVLLGELDSNILPGIKRSLRELSSISELSSDISSINSRLEEAKDILSDVYNDASFEDVDDEESQDEKLDRLSTKLNEINKLKSKYKTDIKGIIAYGNEMKRKLGNIEYSSEEIDRLKKVKDERIKEYFEQATKLSEARHEFAKKLEARVDKELKELNMKAAAFKVKFERKEVIKESGFDDVEFMIRTNLGEDFGKLTKIASGGEISRVMLALKIVFSEVDNLGCLIFDEIDAGISGETVKLVANKLKVLSNNVQIICVTHSPSIAAKSSEQFLIEKSQQSGTTVTSIKKLSYEERINEIARIISGNEITDDLRKHIKEMMK